jgi:hypothetical protein
VTASKKKNLDATEVLTSMTMLAAMTARKATTFITRMPFRMMYPGPARDLDERVILRRFDTFFSVLVVWKMLMILLGRIASKGR